ncbi:hypothetical protein QOT17_019040 [Balamuthia mandrillaris]
MATHRDELQGWAARNAVTDLLGVLVENGFMTVASVMELSREEMRSIGIVKLGDQKRLQISQRSATTVRAWRSRHPQAKSIKAVPQELSPVDSSWPCLHRARQLPSSTDCGFLDLHPEEKRRSKRQAAEQKKRKREETTKELKAIKERRNELLRVQPEPKYDGWWQPVLQEVVDSDPEKYSMEAGSTKRAKAMIEVARRYSSLRRSVKQQARHNRLIRQELKCLNATPSEELEYIQRRQKELGACIQQSQDGNCPALHNYVPSVALSSGSAAT